MIAFDQPKPSVPQPQPQPQPHAQQIVRGFFGLGLGAERDSVIHITSDADFLVCIWARNIEDSPGGVQVDTPPSRFRGRSAGGPRDGLVLDVPSQTGMDLGCIGGSAGEILNILGGNSRISVFVTVITERSAHVAMTSDPPP